MASRPDSSPMAWRDGVSQRSRGAGSRTDCAVRAVHCVAAAARDGCMGGEAHGRHFAGNCGPKVRAPSISANRFYTLSPCETTYCLSQKQVAKAHANRTGATQPLTTTSGSHKW